MDSLPVSGIFFQPLMYLFFGILIYEFLLETQKFKVFLCHPKKKIRNKNGSNPRKFPPKDCNDSHP